MRGKGAEIFFGEFAPAAATRANPHTEESPAAAALPTPLFPNARTDDPQASEQESTHVSKQERNQEWKQASVPVSKTVSSQDREQASLQASVPASAETPSLVPDLDRLEEQLAAQGTLTNSFRYTRDELSRLTDVIYEVNKRHAVKLTKQDAARLGLNVVLADYRARGDESLLGQLARRRRRPRRGGRR
jgi:hypothetical protein